MEDFLKRKLEIGDSVVFITPYHRAFAVGRVDSFTPKRVRVLTGDKTWKGDPAISIQEPSQLVKVDGPDLTMYLLKK